MAEVGPREEEPWEDENGFFDGTYYWEYDEEGFQFTRDIEGHPFIQDPRTGEMTQIGYYGESFSANPETAVEDFQRRMMIRRAGGKYWSYWDYPDAPGDDDRMDPSEQTELFKRRIERSKKYQGQNPMRHPWQAFRKKVDDKLFEYQRENFVHPHPKCLELVQHENWEIRMGELIIGNCLTIILQQELGESEGLNLVFAFFENLFTLTFTVELYIRLRAFSWAWAFDTGANFCDVLLVIVTGVLVTWILAPMGVPVSDLRKLTLLRILRLYRLAVAVKLNPKFREMWLLISGIVGSIAPLFWSLAVIAFMLFLFGVTATQFVARQMESNAHAQYYFGRVAKSMFTLFQIWTLDSWDEIVRPLEKDVWWFQYFIFAFFSVGIFVVANLVIAVIVENVFIIAKEYDFEQARILSESNKKAFEELKALFYCISEDQKNFDFSEFWFSVNGQNKLGARFRSKLKHLGFKAGDILAVKSLLVEENGIDEEIDVELFSYCLKKIKSLANAQDVLVLQKAITTLEKQITVIEVHCNIILEALDTFYYELSTVDVDLNLIIMMASKVCDVVDHILKAHTQRKEILREYHINQNIVKAKLAKKKRDAAQDIGHAG